MDNKDLSRCYGKPAPKTYDAMYVKGHYKDPREVSAKVKAFVSATVAIVAIVIPFIYFL